MSKYGHVDSSGTKEYFDSEEVFDSKVEKLAAMIKAAKHFVVFTGAGISTSVGIPDFRSGPKTVLKTGAGLWQRTSASKKGQKMIMNRAVPSLTHMALFKLIEEGVVKFLVSQNIDGLHRKSGIPYESLAELHGNRNLEKCAKCGKHYMRDFRTRTALDVHDHKTGRKCDDPKCGGDLYDTIVNFEESLPKRDMNLGFEHCAKADLCLALGSSLVVTPAADMPALSAKYGKLVIVKYFLPCIIKNYSLQKTPLDSMATMVVHGLIDKFMLKLMNKLGYKIPKFYLTRYCRLILKEKEEAILVKGIDEDGAPFSCFTQVTLMAGKTRIIVKREPFALAIPKGIKEFNLVIYSYGHYKEPGCKIPVNLKEFKPISYKLVFDPALPEKGWLVTPKQIFQQYF
eukprot:TRINITY_DN105249_c1_g1_i1.p1 TRINITY_DN105249_c1_g1~~TRINITY_DN105249_c1_g1_i1.p1  ORF type:complete len:460 (+),score=31.77 TRINITY_DN105249_c1_g1_i1:186-1382(+)